MEIINKVLFLIAIWIFIFLVSLLIYPMRNKDDDSEKVAVIIVSFFISTLITSIIGGFWI